MISIPFEQQKKKGHLKLGNICDGILDRHLAEKQTKSMLARAKNPLFDKNGKRKTQKLYKALREYFLLCSSILKVDWLKQRKGFFYTNNGINVLLRVYEACLTYYSHKPSKAELAKILRVINKWLREGYNRSDLLEGLGDKRVVKAGVLIFQIDFLV